LESLIERGRQTPKSTHLQKEGKKAVAGGVKVTIPKGRTLTGRAIDTPQPENGGFGSRGEAASIFSQEFLDKLDDINSWGWLRRRTSHHQHPRDCFFGNPIEAYIILLRIDPFYYFSVQFPHLDV
jgi:hypothetical protein